MKAFDMQPDVAAMTGEYEAHLAGMYDKIVGASHPMERKEKRMSLDGFIKGFAATTDLVP